jgi:hypothetical protein
MIVAPISRKSDKRTESTRIVNFRNGKEIGMFTDDNDDRSREERFYTAQRNWKLRANELSDFIHDRIDEELEYREVLHCAISWNKEQEHKFLPMYVEDKVDWIWSHPRKKKHPVVKNNS